MGGVKALSIGAQLGIEPRMFSMLVGCSYSQSYWVEEE